MIADLHQIIIRPSMTQQIDHRYLEVRSHICSQARPVKCQFKTSAEKRSRTSTRPPGQNAT